MWSTVASMQAFFSRAANRCRGPIDWSAWADCASRRDNFCCWKRCNGWRPLACRSRWCWREMARCGSVVESDIVRRGLEGKVQITGWISNDTVRKHILDARALVLPSFAEGLPVVIMEALALGRPVVSTYVAGIPELVENGVNGWLVPAGSVEDLTKVLQEVLAVPVERLTEMGRAGMASVAARHDAAREAARLAHLFRPEIGVPQQSFVAGSVSDGGRVMISTGLPSLTLSTAKETPISS